MFLAVPSHLAGAARAQFEAFLTPKNLALLAGFFVLVAAVQAAPVADAVVDAILTGLAWAMYGWAGLVAVRDLIEAVIKAGRAQSQADIDQAADLAASALVVLGVTLFLKKLADRVKVENATGPKPAEEPEPGSGSQTKPASKPLAANPRRIPNPDKYVKTRVDQLREQIPENSRGRITMAVGVVENQTGEQSVLVGTSEPRGYIRPGVTLDSDETMVPGTGHAEADIVNYATSNDLNVVSIGATRPVCDICQSIIPSDTSIATPLK
jgi:filamentous hemagglutinin